ncbi:SDR family NAD(P)-dependent oxidoreductase [Thiomicrorhabdus sp. zzn3]|uniref:SDR family NAD(P)-dependent oxidoreductase n=1 Tax=Thiomicrorhabdus sp. zzn3 TaxID=3039775 RepID=UPI0024363825|nr:SDR family NAD(P)-dependent oxidoreductase [Thiomicrorhabdus sp. zzn3]MDG6778501.1 SDR family NAD(P)-dependent oxidoreductase [Thiomicrorhabdus sp. zzn3]
MQTLIGENGYKGLKGKRVLITGASSGIGAGMARVLAREGARLVLHYNRNAEGIERTMQSLRDYDGQAQMLRCDFRQLDRLESFFKQAWSIYEGLDALVNNAGIVTKTTALNDPFGEQFSDTLKVNLQAPYQLSTAFAQACISAGQSGAIVNNTSIHGQATCEWFSAYAASKAGLDAMTKVQAVEWGRHGIRVNGLAPGVVPVERTQTILSEAKMQQKWHDQMPLGRYGTTEEMGEATAFLLSDACNWMTGSILTMDGGLIARGNYPGRE